MKMAEGGPHDCETQKNEIGELLKTPLKKGDTWYLVDSRWFKQWKKYVGYDSWDTSYVGDDTAHPGPIDNTPLLKEGTKNQLREHLIEELDHVLVPTEAWDKLLAWYGIAEGQEAIARKVIEQGMFVKHCKVEVYLMDLKLCTNADVDQVQVHQFSRVNTIEQIEKEMRKLFNIEDEKEVRLWNKYMSNTYERLSKPDNTVQDAGLYQGQVIVIEQKNEDGTWPRQTKVTPSTSMQNNSLEIDSYSSSPSTRTSNTYSNYSSSYSTSYYNSSYDSYRGGSAAPGLCGLSNLGNTCFMNSAIQCMSNVPQLTEYFLGEVWQEELNVDNPLGMKGEIATSYAELIRNMWSGKYSYTIPRNFKIAVGRFAPQFSGYQQQDSQELMAFLLDGLHEDLNRIKKKPYIELKEGDNRPDEEVSKEAWDNYLRRNDSIIVDTFHGLLKSTLVCPQCQKISVTFDPFCYLSLPLPIRKERQIEVFLVPNDPARKPRRYKLTVPKMGTVSELCKALSKFTQIPADRMVVTDVYNHRFHKVFSPDDGLSHILDKDDIFIYEVSVSTGDDPETMILSIYMREKKVRQGYNNCKHVGTQLFGQPLLVAVPRKNCTYQTLYNGVLNKMSRYVKIPDDNSEWWKNDKTHNNSKKDQEETNGQENGEVEMNHSEDDSEDMDEPDTNVAAEQNGTASEENGVAEESEESDEGGKPPGLFTFQVVNSYGTMDVDSLQDDGKPIKFHNRSYIAIDWNPKAKEIFYDDKAAEEFEEDESMSHRPIQKKQVIQLNECLNLFTTTEKLGAQDPWYCPQCKKHQQATKKFDLWSLPKFLVIHLKRFSYNRYLRDKLDAFVEFPTRGLDMKGFLKNKGHGPATYDLLGVVNHYGGMGGGHYTAYAKNKDDNHWYHFDDSTVSQTAEDSVVTKAGYVLVYQRREVNHSAGQNHCASATIVNSTDNNTMETSPTAVNGDDDMDVN